MAATRVPPPPFSAPLLDGIHLSGPWKIFLSALHGAVHGEGFDKVDAGYQAAMSAAPATAEVVGVGGLHIGGQIGGNVALAFYVVVTSVAKLPAGGAAEGDWAYALDGRKAGEAAGAGTGVPAWWSNGNWCAADSGLIVAA